eukprot:708854-Prymnesium_polylepis.1
MCIRDSSCQVTEGDAAAIGDGRAGGDASGVLEGEPEASATEDGSEDDYIVDNEGDSTPDSLSDDELEAARGHAE